MPQESGWTYGGADQAWDGARERMSPPQSGRAGGVRQSRLQSDGRGRALCEVDERFARTDSAVEYPENAMGCGGIEHGGRPLWPAHVAKHAMAIGVPFERTPGRVGVEPGIVASAYEPLALGSDQDGGGRGDAPRDPAHRGDIDALRSQLVEYSGAEVVAAAVPPVARLPAKTRRRRARLRGHVAVAFGESGREDFGRGRGDGGPPLFASRPACRERGFGASKRGVNESTQRGPLAAKIDGQARRVTDVPRGTRRWRTKWHGPRLFHVEQACVARGRQHDRVADVAEAWTRFPEAPPSVVVGGPQRLGRLAAFRRPGFAV